MTNESASVTRADRIVDLWQVLVIGSFVASLVRSSVPLFPYPRAVSGLLGVQALLLALAVLVAWRRRGAHGFMLTAPVLALGCFGAVGLVSAAWSLRPGVSVTQSLAVLFIAGFFAATVSWRWREPGAAPRDIDVVFWAVVAVTVLGLLLACFRVPWVVGDYFRFTGLTNNANYAGMIAATVLPWGYWRYVHADGRVRWAWVTGAALLAVSIFLSGSRGAALAAAIAVVLVHLLSPRRWRRLPILVAAAAVAYLAFRLVYILGGIAAGALLSLLSGSSVDGGLAGLPDSLGRIAEQSTDITSGRSEIYRLLGRAWLERPIGGWGYGTTQYLGSTDGLSAHNIYLLVLVELGILGFALFTWCIVGIVRSGGLRKAPGLAAAGIGVLLMELTESSILGFGGPNALLAWLVLFAWASEGLAIRVAGAQTTGDAPDPHGSGGDDEHGPAERTAAGSARYDAVDRPRPGRVPE